MSRSTGHHVRAKFRGYHVNSCYMCSCCVCKTWVLCCPLFVVYPPGLCVGRLCFSFTWFWNQQVLHAMSPPRERERPPQASWRVLCLVFLHSTSLNVKFEESRWPSAEGVISYQHLIQEAFVFCSECVKFYGMGLNVRWRRVWWPMTCVSWLDTLDPSYAINSVNARKLHEPLENGSVL